MKMLAQSDQFIDQRKVMERTVLYRLSFGGAAF